MQYDKADQQNCPRRVVFYGRVSTELEAQISALKNQMNWYLELAEHHPNWTVVGQYADEGISGTGMKIRPSFMKMLRDARKKKFELIVTREVSRFARNTVDTLVTTRELKQYGVEVYFVNDDIWTMRGDGEVRLTIMASLAQDESRKMSERTKAGIQTSQKKGTYVAGPTPFGYKRDKKAHTLVVQESQAETVRKIFAWYADGINGTEIAQTLTQEGAPNKSGMPQWSARQVLSITKNTIYKGYLTYAEGTRKMSKQDKQTTEIEQGEDTFTLSSMQTPDSNSMRNKWLSSVALTVLLSIALAVTTLAIGYSLAEVPNNTFRTGTIKLNLNDGRPVIQRTVRYEPGATIQSTFTLSNEGTWEVYYKLYFSEIHGDLAKILDVTIAEQNGNTLYQGKMADLIRRNVRVSDSRLAVGQCKTFTITLHFPEQSGNRYQDTDLTFLLCADAVQTKNNPTALFS